LTQQRTNCNNADKVRQTDIQLAHSSRPAAPSTSNTNGNGASASAAI
jgi:hypothetical protein